MSYCRNCGVEITYIRTKNEKWMPCDLLTGQPHFCTKDKTQKRKSGLAVCKKCGKPVFFNKNKMIDYSTLQHHECKAGDITRYKKYQQKLKR